jgi:scyllo-inositol 2-dehydrogenase (NADP+)
VSFREYVEDAMNVALLGYGYAGRTIHAPLIQSVPGLRLATIFSSDPAKVHRDLPGVAVVSSPDEVFAQADVSLIVIATPNDTHFDLASRALRNGKHVVVDKPFTTTVSEAAELVALAGNFGRLLSVFHSRRWDADFLTLRKVIATGELGEVVHFESHYDRYRPNVLERWRERPGPGSGIWFDLGAHLVDQALQLFGMPEAVYGDLAIQRSQARATDYFHVLLRYGRTRVVLHGSNLVAEAPRRFEVHGTGGSFVKQGMDTQEDALKRGERPGGAGWGGDPQDGTLTTWSNGTGKCHPFPTVPGNYLAYYEAIRDAIGNGAGNPVPPDEALAVMAVLELAVESAAAGRELPCAALKE